MFAFLLFWELTTFFWARSARRNFAFVTNFRFSMHFKSGF